MEKCEKCIFRDSDAIYCNTARLAMAIENFKKTVPILRKTIRNYECPYFEEEKKLMNTRISYLYRDASNYKQHNEVTIPGTFTEEQIDTIIGCLELGEYFIPKQIGFPEKRFEKITDDDHCWFELSRDCFEETDAEPDIEILPDEVVRRFEVAYRNWDTSEAFGGGLE